MKKTPFWGRQHIIESADLKKVFHKSIPVACCADKGGDAR